MTIIQKKKRDRLWRIVSATFKGTEVHQGTLRGEVTIRRGGGKIDSYCTSGSYAKIRRRLQMHCEEYTA